MKKYVIFLIITSFILGCSEQEFIEKENDMELPNSEISVSLVKQMLNASTNDVGSLCTHPNINMWSKYKPVRFPKITTADAPEWWKGDDGFCGLDIAYGNVTEIANKQWGYNRPYGSSRAPYRLGDFRRYSDEVNMMIEEVSMSSAIKINQNKVNLFMAGCSTFTMPNYNVSLADMPSEFKNSFLTVLLYNRNQKVWKALQAPDPIIDEGTYLQADTREFFFRKDEVVDCYMYLCRQKISNINDIPDFTGYSIKVTDNTVCYQRISVIDTTVSEPTYVRAEIKVEGVTEGMVIFPAITVKFSGGSGVFNYDLVATGVPTVDENGDENDDAPIGFLILKSGLSGKSGSTSVFSDIVINLERRTGGISISCISKTSGILVSGSTLINL